MVRAHRWCFVLPSWGQTYEKGRRCRQSEDIVPAKQGAAPAIIRQPRDPNTHSPPCQPTPTSS